MNWMLCMVGLVILGIAGILAFIMYCTLGKSSELKHASEYILYRFEPDNTAPKVTDLIEFHKEHDDVKYIID